MPQNNMEEYRGGYGGPEIYQVRFVENHDW